MSEVRLVIRDVQRAIYADRHGSFADSVIAALSADPETIEELDCALERFIAPSEWSFFRGFHPGEDDRPHDAGLVVIDLAARLVACESTYSTAASKGCVLYHDGSSATDVLLKYHLSDDWRLLSHANDRQAAADKRRRERPPLLDTRPVLYGEPLLTFIARECFAAFPGHPVTQEEDYKNPAYNDEYDLIRQIHTRWMMAPREDLRGQTPRQVLVTRHKRLGWDYQDRKEQWTDLDRCPRGLETESAAYRFGGFGTHENVVYYDMVRYLLWRCREAVVEQTRVQTAIALQIDGFVAAEVPRLAELREQWLDAPFSEFSDRTPRSIIHNERARLPEAVTGQEAIIDDDCPLCQLQADLPGPTFWNLDGCNMDDDFAFCIWHETYEEWEQERREWEEHDRKWNAQQEERKRLGVESSGGGYTNPDYVWRESFSASKSLGQSMFMRLFAIGSHLCELTVDLKQPNEERNLIDRLSCAYGNLREVAQSSDVELGSALIEPVLNNFICVLEAVTDARPDLAEKCTDLQCALGRFLEPPVPNNDEPEEFDNELDLPF